MDNEIKSMCETTEYGQFQFLFSREETSDSITERVLVGILDTINEKPVLFRDWHTNAPAKAVQIIKRYFGLTFFLQRHDDYYRYGEITYPKLGSKTESSLPDKGSQARIDAEVKLLKEFLLVNQIGRTALEIVAYHILDIKEEK